jgi:acetyl-CoA acetyltransferase
MDGRDPVIVSAVQVNRASCSSMEAIRIGSMAIRLGEANAIIAGGGESMNNVSYSIKNARWGLRFRHHELSDGVWDGLMDPYIGLIMGMKAENAAEKYRNKSLKAIMFHFRMRFVYRPRIDQSTKTDPLSHPRVLRSR